MRPPALVSWIVPALVVLAPAAAWSSSNGAAGVPAYASRITTNNRIALSVTNHGVFGNNFVTRAASLEYPAGAGYEHLVHGGLWVGAQAQDASGAFTGVVTGCVDVAVGSTTPLLTEFTPLTNAVLVRSNLPASFFYSPDAISEEDLIASYFDFYPQSSASNPEPHRPMGIGVRQQTHSWSWASVRDALFLRFTIVNTGTSPLTGAWVGLYTELASGNKAGYVNWPPSAGDPGGLGRWYGRKWLQYEDSLRMVREHYCAALPVPAGCILSRVPYWIGVQLLTHPAAGQQVTLAAWPWSPVNAARDQDVERYALMSAGTIQNLTAAGLMPQTGDPVELLALGPFAAIAAGDSIRVDFAIVGGADEGEIHRNAIVAQRVHDAGYDQIATPALLSLARAEPAHDRVRLAWIGAEAGASATIERNATGGWSAVGEAVADARGAIEFVDHGVVSGRRYGYRVAIEEPGGTWRGGEVWVDVPFAALALDGVHPNPVAGRDAEVRITLADRGPARLEAFDLAGRRVWSRRLAFPAGSHAVPLEGAAGWAPGVYVLRLTQGEGFTTARIVVMR